MIKGTFIASAMTIEQLVAHEGSRLRTRVEWFQLVLLVTVEIGQPNV
jgi:hypothetical protein